MGREEGSDKFQRPVEASPLKLDLGSPLPLSRVPSEPPRAQMGPLLLLVTSLFQQEMERE